MNRQRSQLSLKSTLLLVWGAALIVFVATMFVETRLTAEFSADFIAAHSEEGIVASTLLHLSSYAYLLIALNIYCLSLAGYLTISLIRIKKFQSHETVLDRRYEEMEKLAMFDALTGLGGRTNFIDRLKQAISFAVRENAFVGVLYMDLDGFKSINDEFGHQAGDHVLKVVSNRWQACLRGSDIVARLSGDEFGVVLPNLRAPNHAVFVSNKLIEALHEDIRLPGGKMCSVSVSIGISIYPMNAVDVDTLIDAADAAMYKSKQHRMNCYTLSDAVPNIDTSTSDLFISKNMLVLEESSVDELQIQFISLVKKLTGAIEDNMSATDIKEIFDALMQLNRERFRIGISQPFC